MRMVKRAWASLQVISLSWWSSADATRDFSAGVARLVPTDRITVSYDGEGVPSGRMVSDKAKFAMNIKEVLLDVF